MHEELPRCTKLPNNHAEHIQNGAQSTDVTTSLKKHNNKTTQVTNLPNTQTQHIKSTPQGTNMTNHQREYIQKSA